MRELSLNSLNNDKLDKDGTAINSLRVNGFTVETNVPAGAKFTDTIYTHPDTHPASIITTDSNNRLVTDEEKTTWNNKLDKNATAINSLKVNGLTVETAVPANAKFTDTVYTHPVNHPASIISQDANNRFVTDTEKANWNNKAEKTVSTTSANGLMSSTDKTKLDGITFGATKVENSVTNGNIKINETEIAVYTHPITHSLDEIEETTTKKIMTDVERNKLNGIEVGANKYTHPSTHPANIIIQDTNNRFVSDTEKNAWNNKLDKDGIAVNSLKVNGLTVETAVPAGAKFTDTIYTHPSTHPATMITQDTNNRFVTDTEKTTWNSKASGSHTHNIYDERGVGAYSHAEGYNTNAEADSSHAEGIETIARGRGSHAEGMLTNAIGSYSHAEGLRSSANGVASHAGGYGCSAVGDYSFASGEGTSTQIYLPGAFIIGSYGNATHSFSWHLANGTSSDKRGLAARIQSNGAAYANGAWSSTGADYAELFEWEDGNENNEDRVALFVTLNGDKIKIANKDDDYILGIVSADPAIIGDNAELNWHGRYLLDKFGRKQYHEIKIPAVYEEVIKYDENGNEIKEQVLVANEKTEIIPIENPDWNSNMEYIPRQQRKEWSPIGMIGKLLVIDDGTCVVNGYCKPNNQGVATVTDNGYRVMKRVDENLILVLFR